MWLYIYIYIYILFIDAECEISFNQILNNTESTLYQSQL